LLYGALAALTVYPISQGLKILLGNDDGYGSANIRAFYGSLKASGHDVVLVAPVVDNSGQGGRSVFTTYSTLQSEGEYDLVAAGAPSIAADPSDSHICLYGQRSYLQINQTTVTGYPDPAVVYANLSTSLVNQLAKNTKKGQPLLPLAYGLNVNYPSITSLTNASCIAPKFFQTRLTGGAFTDEAVFNATSGTFSYANILGSGVNACINGNCSLPGETSAVNAGCQSSVSVFTVDYDAPATHSTASIMNSLKPLVGTNATALHTSNGG
ncbi:MAG: hypothetical protein LQ340_007360, partial [Diploschistes diacapsis]